MVGNWLVMKILVTSSIPFLVVDKVKPGWVKNGFGEGGGVGY